MHREIPPRAGGSCPRPALPPWPVGARAVLAAALLVVCAGRSAPAEPSVFVERGATWRWLPGRTEASSPDTTAWREPGFDDSGWAEGPAPFGYGDGPFGTELPGMRNEYTTLFLRTGFEVSDPGRVTELQTFIDYDDGFVLWLNGEELVRANAPADPLRHDQLAPSGHESGTYEFFSELGDPESLLEPGTNVVAVQVFNVSLTSSDLKLDVELLDPFGPDLSPPRVVSLVPPAGARVRSLDRVEVLFDESVDGVDAADLRIDGSPATGVTGSGEGPWVFTFPERPPGPVGLRWADGHGITDVAEDRNPFGGGSWTYTVDPDTPQADLVISELVAASAGGLLDEDGEEADWFEIWNRGSEAVDVAGFSVTDDPDRPGQWVLPSRMLDAGERLVVFATGKDRRGPGELHTNFRLDAEGEYLGLWGTTPPRSPVMEFTPGFPELRAGIAYGLDSTGTPAYLQPPTPDGPNGASVAFEGILPPPSFSVPRGLHDEPFVLELATVGQGAAIRYTLDGSAPGPDAGRLYDGPIDVAPRGDVGVVTVRAAAFQEGWLPSRVATHSYVFPDAVLDQPADIQGFPSVWGSDPSHPADYEVDPRVVDPRRPEAREALRSIPTLCLSTDLASFFDVRNGIYANPSRSGLAWERATSAEWIEPGGDGDFQIDCGVRIQGGSSTRNWKSVKLSMRLLFKGDYGAAKLREPIFPDSPVDTFDSIVLDAHLNLAYTHPSHGQRVRSQFVRDIFVADLQNATGSLAPHGRFAHLYLNGVYWGLYDIHERPDNAFCEEHLGGEKEEWDIFRHSGGGLVDGEAAAWNRTFQLARRDLSDRSNYLELREWLDVLDLADYMIVNFYVGNDDWPRHNWYAGRRRRPGETFRFFSWDAEHVLKDVGINRLGVGNSGSPAELYQNLRANEDWRLLFADRVHRHFSRGGPMYVDPQRPAWDPENPQRNQPAARYMRRIDEIWQAVLLESARWGDAERPARPYTRDDEFQDELDWLLGRYFPQRSDVVLGQFRSAGLFPDTPAPEFDREGGAVEPGTSVALALPAGEAGTIWYTVDGTDPRVGGSGAVSGSATRYEEPLTIDDSVRILARARDGSEWSPLADASFTVVEPREALRIAEIHYHPAADGNAEFLELVNTADVSVDATGLRFESGVDYAFGPGSILGPGARYVLVRDPDAFAAAYPEVVPDGVYGGALSNAGERLRLVDEVGARVDSADWDDDGFWPLGADGFGWSLVRADLEGDPERPASWRQSAGRGGSPGGADPGGAPGGVVLSEVLTNSEAPLEDAIELHNPTGAPVAVGGWFLSDSRAGAAQLRKYRIPEDTVLAPGGYHVIYEDRFNADPGAPGSFALGSDGDDVYLASAEAAGELTGHIVGHELDPARPGVSLGRVPTSQGFVFTALAERTFGVDQPATVEEFRGGEGAPNSGPRQGVAVLNELHYHPALGVEFLEIANRTGTELPLFDEELERGWRVRGLRSLDGTDAWEFPPGTALPAGGHLVLVPVDPQTFRSLRGVPDAAEVAGPYGGALDNGGERVTLLRPMLHEESGAVVHTAVDSFRYDDVAPWPETPDGAGPSLERFEPGIFADDPDSWDASLVGGGTPGEPNSISEPGANRRPRASFIVRQIAGAPLEVELDGSPSSDPDGEVVAWSWDFGDGSDGEGELVRHAFERGGSWTVRLTVTDEAGATASASRTVEVEGPAEGLQRPGDVNQDAVLDISDAIALLERLFLGGATALPCEGALEEGGNLVVHDLNADGGVDITDAVYGLDFLFRGGSAPVLGTGCIPAPGCPEVCVP